MTIQEFSEKAGPNNQATAKPDFSSYIMGNLNDLRSRTQTNEARTQSPTNLQLTNDRTTYKLDDRFEPQRGPCFPQKPEPTKQETLDSIRSRVNDFTPEKLGELYKPSEHKKDYSLKDPKDLAAPIKLDDKFLPQRGPSLPQKPEPTKSEFLDSIRSRVNELTPEKLGELYKSSEHKKDYSLKDPKDLVAPIKLDDRFLPQRGPDKKN
jgi:hypothetical protein